MQQVWLRVGYIRMIKDEQDAALHFLLYMRIPILSNVQPCALLKNHQCKRSPKCPQNQARVYTDAACENNTYDEFANEY